MREKQYKCDGCKGNFDYLLYYYKGVDLCKDCIVYTILRELEDLGEKIYELLNPMTSDTEETYKL